MKRFLLSTSNIVSGGPAILQNSAVEKSNSELVASLRANFADAQEDAESEVQPKISLETTNGNGINKLSLSSWTTLKGNLLYVPSIDWHQVPLTEDRSAYDITVKLFYLPGLSPIQRLKPTTEALDLVLRELAVQDIDLLILSFPAITYDQPSTGPLVDCYGLHIVNGKAGSEPLPETDDEIYQTWKVAENIHASGKARSLGVSEFGATRLQKLLERARIRPTVDQINLDDCCDIPTELGRYANSVNVELLTHNDCPDPLPKETVRDLLGHREGGAGVMGLSEDTTEGNRELVPKWVVKYTAVVKNRGVVENKGYFALVEVGGDLHWSSRSH